MPMSARPNILIFCFDPSNIPPDPQKNNIITLFWTPTFIFYHTNYCQVLYCLPLTCLPTPNNMLFILYLLKNPISLWFTDNYCSVLVLVSVWGGKGDVFYFNLRFIPDSWIPACADQTWVTKKPLLLPHDEANGQNLIDSPGKQRWPLHSAVLCQWLPSIICDTVCLLCKLLDLALYCICRCCSITLTLFLFPRFQITSIYYHTLLSFISLRGIPMWLKDLSSLSGSYHMGLGFFPPLFVPFFSPYCRKCDAKCSAKKCVWFKVPELFNCGTSLSACKEKEGKASSCYYINPWSQFSSGLVSCICPIDFRLGHMFLKEQNSTPNLCNLNF